MRPGRVAAVFFMLAAMVFLASEACPETVLLVGVGSTHGFGERSPYFEVSGFHSSTYLMLETSWFSADKIESGKGWGARGAAELRWKALGLGAAYSYRNGGSWVKHYPWLRASLSFNPITIIGEYALGGVNHEKKLELRLGHTLHGVRMETRGFVESHLQGTGLGVIVFVGIGR